MMIRSLQKQTDKYVSSFGVGAVVFSSGFAASVAQEVSAGVLCIGFDQLQEAVGIATGGGKGSARKTAKRLRDI
jgi:hypothetical protein